MKVSIVCMEGVEFNSECLFSLLNQTFENFEIILPQKYYLEDDRITCGASPSGDYIFLIDMTKVFAPNMLDVMLTIMNNTSSDVGICGRINNATKTSVITTIADTHDKKFALSKRLLRKKLLFTPNNAIIRNDGSLNFFDSYLNYLKNSRIYNFSNAFVIGDGSKPSKAHILDVLNFFLSGGLYD